MSSLTNVDRPPRWERIIRTARGLFWISFTVCWIVAAVIVAGELTAGARVETDRALLIERLQEQRHSRVIAMIHREDTLTLLGVPVSSFIDIEDSEAVLRAIRLTPDDQPLDFILHTPGGLVLAAEQIAHALGAHRGKVTVFVPHYAMSGGTLLALAADEIVMDPNAVLGPVDPQIDSKPAASIVKVLSEKPAAQIDDDTLILADVAQKARIQVAGFVEQLLLKRLPQDRAAALAVLLSEGRWTHDFPITVEGAQQLGLPVSTAMPPLIYELMDLYPQADIGRPSVMYVPLHPNTPSAPAAGPDTGLGSRR